MSAIITTTKRKDLNTPRASNKEDTYTFQIQIVRHKSNYKWYIRYQTDNCNNIKVVDHSGHL